MTQYEVENNSANIFNPWYTWLCKITLPYNTSLKMQKLYYLLTQIDHFIWWPFYFVVKWNYIMFQSEYVFSNKFVFLHKGHFVS